LEHLQLDRLVKQLDGAFGDELPFSAADLTVGQLDALHQVFGDVGYQSYLQDQVNRQIIRDYLVNAVMLGYLSESDIAAVSRQIATREDRAALSLHMLMTSVEQARELVTPEPAERLQQLNPGLKRPPYIKLIQG
jgi:hypothetical protein